MTRIEIKDEDIEVYDSSFGFTSGEAFTLSMYSLDESHLEKLKKQIKSDYDIVNRLNYDIEICELALKEKPDDITLKIILHQLKITKYGDETNYPKSILGKQV